MYSERARELRRCVATCKGSGERCTNAAVWTDPRGLCGAHGGRVRQPHIREKTAYIPCTCRAYKWPHRPGSGLCRWPDEPKMRLNHVAGRHSSEYKELRSWLGQPPSLALWWHFEREKRWP